MRYLCQEVLDNLQTFEFSYTKNLKLSHLSHNYKDNEASFVIVI